MHKVIEEAPPDEKFMHAATYSGHPTCCAVGLANIDIMEKEGLPERAAVMGKRLQDGLQTLRSLPAVGDVRGLGMLAAIELVEDQGSRKPAPRPRRPRGGRVRQARPDHPPARRQRRPAGQRRLPCAWHRR